MFCMQFISTTNNKHDFDASFSTVNAILNGHNVILSYFLQIIFIPLQATPLLEFNQPTGQTVAMGDAVTLLLEVQIPVSTTTSYSLIVKAPFSTTAIFKVCSVEIQTIGENMPCVHKEDKKTVYSSRDLTSSSPEPDMATLDLGGITNLNLNSSTAASTIVFEITIAPLNHTAAVDSSFHNVEVTLNYAGTSTVYQTSSIQIVGTSVLTTSVSVSYGSFSFAQPSSYR